MTRENLIQFKNVAVRRVLVTMEEDIGDKIDPKTYNEIRNNVRYNFNWLLNQIFRGLHLESVPLKRENSEESGDATS